MEKLLDILYRRGLISASDKEDLMREVNIEESVSPYRTKVIDKVKSMYHIMMVENIKVKNMI